MVWLANITNQPKLYVCLKSYKPIIDRFCLEFGDFGIYQVSSDDVLRFLNRFIEGNKSYTKRIRYSHICSFFNFIRNNLDHSLHNPCDSSMVRKQYRERVVSKWKIIEKETVKLILQESKSGREHERVFIPQKVADRLREYALEVCKSPDDRIFPISYEGPG